MMEARHNQITSLARLTFGPLVLDSALAPGAWRLLTDAETAALENCGGADTGAPADATDVSTASRNTEKDK